MNKSNLTAAQTAAIRNMSAEELFKRGYVGLSNKHRVIARIDRADWLQHMARHYRRSVADFYVRTGPMNTLGDHTGEWGKHYCGIFSTDSVCLIREDVYAELKRLWNDADGIVEYVPPTSVFKNHRDNAKLMSALESMHEAGIISINRTTQQSSYGTRFVVRDFESFFDLVQLREDAL